MDVAIVTSCRHATLSCAHRLADARPRFIGRRSVSTILSQVCLGRPVLCRHSTGGSMMQAWEGAVMILPRVGAVEVTIERETTSTDSV